MITRDEVGDAALASRVKGEVDAAGGQRADTLHQESRQRGGAGPRQARFRGT
ncbi:MAG: hypothetical protein QOJ85_4890, partial [Solirubrobacteraceae bacterium]|nr:hypothetical protein [Solirubrobacteraceae bacterium]